LGVNKPNKSLLGGGKLAVGKLKDLVKIVEIVKTIKKTRLERGKERVKRKRLL